MTKSSSPCASCKLLRRKCTPECIFAPYFPAEQPWKFASVHRVYGTSNVGKLLRDISPEQREDAVASLVFEAEARLMDPVYGCVGRIFYLQSTLREVALNLAEAKKELAAFDPLMTPQHDSLPCLIQPPEACPAGMDIGEQPQMQPVFDDDEMAWISSLTETLDFSWMSEPEFQPFQQPQELQQPGQCGIN